MLKFNRHVLIIRKNTVNKIVLHNLLGLN
jgi:hypothetical protein